MHEKYGDVTGETFTKQTALLRNDLSQDQPGDGKPVGLVQKQELGFRRFSGKYGRKWPLFLREVQAQLRLSIEQKKLTVDNQVPGKPLAGAPRYFEDHAP